ncbi:hypothetical protein BgiMline_022798 [Biomphalaria glabrata]|uniref:Uncharacterized protein LOC106067321 n=1 Tax=Biomphalaria glabrata TaxID=6526 RepID=A0A2C9M289_BIOGL|nr:uncharacterized protein LOC106067321 [Biomphalaria glabrata]XP_055893206.1 uncharacterized protein LOC106067321 [Biomphalaria glabrata]KAI8757103.1 hypothetical protein BgiMline_010618 [Biomphalaria glabrata]KAI8798565.1 hypothetical protein BgiBS90_000868 [Biomphalaria glabrata]
MSTPPSIYFDASSAITSSSVKSTPPVISSPKTMCRRSALVPKVDSQLGRVVEFPDLPEIHSERKMSNDRDPHPWKHLATNPSFFGHRVTKPRRLESINLRGSKCMRRSSLNKAHSSSSKRSDSVTNYSSHTPDSQDALTSTSTDKLLRDSTPAEPAGIRLRTSSSLTVEDQEMQWTIEKCMNWIEKLPDKFSGMHIVQERATVYK